MLLRLRASLILLIIICAPAVSAWQPGVVPAPQGAAPANPDPLASPELTSEVLFEELRAVVIRLPLAAALGTALALRPRRRGTPMRQPAVVQTQIVLAIVGALIMLVVGASLARAFGIVGAANLIRYRSKIDDPKDAVVMLCALAVGLAAGVGLFMLALFSTLFLVAALWVIEGSSRRPASSSCRCASATTPRRSGRRSRPCCGASRPVRAATVIGGRSLVPVTAPLEMHTDRVSNALDAARRRQGRGEVERKIQGQSKVEPRLTTRRAVKLIVQPDAGVMPLVQAIRRARKTMHVVDFPFRSRRDRARAETGGGARRPRAGADRAYQQRRREPVAQARTAAARRRRDGGAIGRRSAALSRQVPGRRRDDARLRVQLHQARYRQEPQLRHRHARSSALCRRR